VVKKLQLKNDTLVEYFPLKGGLNLETPPLSIPAGNLIECTNYEALAEGGYRRVKGYERYDGHDAAWSQDYWILDFDAGNVALLDGMLVVGQTSGATGELIVDGALEDGSYGGGDAEGYIVLRAVTGTFVDTETLSFTGVGDGFDPGFSSGFG